jgi:uncharacterized protein with von Willebrand factor type A (vWA) domain
MKKIINIIIWASVILFLVIFVIGYSFYQLGPLIKKTIQENISKETSTPGYVSQISTETTPASEIEKEVEIGLNKLIENIKTDENKSLNDYTKEITVIQQMINKKNIKEATPETLINIAQDLSKISPPPLFYSFHIELIKLYYKIGFYLKEMSKTTDESKKIMLYNLINQELKKIKIK